MRCLITGINGFIGRALWDFLMRNDPGLKLFGADLAASGKNNVFSCQLTQEDVVLRLLGDLRPQLIIHLAGGTHSDPRRLYQNNFVSSEVILKASAALGLPARIVLIGSAAEYGLLMPGRNTCRENSVLRPQTWYGYVKSLQTSLGQSYAREGLDVLTARLFNVCGAGLPENLVLGRIARYLVDIEKGLRDPVLRTGPLGGQRDFLDISDVCSALIEISRSGSRGQIYNVCRGRSLTVRSVIRKMIGLSKVPKVTLEEKQRTELHSRGSCAKLCRVTGWQPQISIEQSLENILDYYRNL